jgi:hypothetical protein
MHTFADGLVGRENILEEVFQVELFLIGNELRIKSEYTDYEFSKTSNSNV